MHNTTSSAGASRVLPWLALLMPPLLWAGNFIAGRAVRGEMMPMTLSMGRWLIALVCLLPFALPAMRRDARRYWTHLWLVLGTAATGMAAFASLVYLGVHTTSASNALMLNSMIPVLIAILGALFYRQPLSYGQAAGALASFAGVFTLLLHGQLAHIAFVRGDVLVLAAMVCFALYTLWLRRLPADLDQIGLMAVQIIVALLLLLPFWLFEHPVNTHHAWTWSASLAMIYVGIFPSVLAYLLYMRAVQHFGPARAGLSIHLIPVFGLALSALVLHERLHVWQGVGLGFIAVGVLLSRRAAATQLNAQQNHHLPATPRPAQN